MWPWERSCVSLSGSKITWQGNTLLVVKFVYLSSTTFLRGSTAKVGEQRAGPEDPPRRIELSVLCELIGRDSSCRRHMVNGDKEKQQFTPHGLCECTLAAQPPFLLLGAWDSCPRALWHSHSPNRERHHSLPQDFSWERQ